MVKRKKPRLKTTSFELSGVSDSLKYALAYGVGGAIALVWGGVSLLQPQAATLQCERTPPGLGLCRLTLVRLFDQRTQMFPVEQLTEATVQANGREKFIVLLVQPSMRITMPAQLESSQVENGRDRINEFVANSELETLSVRQSNRIYTSFKSFAALIGGGTLLFLAVVSWTKGKP